jgi:hypothetical protein
MKCPPSFHLEGISLKADFKTNPHVPFSLSQMTADLLQPLFLQLV